jgi:hypothetical protein
MNVDVARGWPVARSGGAILLMSIAIGVAAVIALIEPTVGGDAVRIERGVAAIVAIVAGVALASALLTPSVNRTTEHIDRERVQVTVGVGSQVVVIAALRRWQADPIGLVQLARGGSPPSRCEGSEPRSARGAWRAASPTMGGWVLGPDRRATSPVGADSGSNRPRCLPRESGPPS